MFKNRMRNIGLFLGLLLTLPLVSNASFADYPEKPLTFVVGFGVGGSADRMTRTMSSFLAEELGQPIRVVNKKGAGTQIAANYVLRRPHDGYTVFASTFSPYLANTILLGSAKYDMKDFDFINGQWWDYDLIAVNKSKPYKTLSDLLTAIKENPKQVSAAVVQGSAGHLMTMLLLEANNIPRHHLNLVTYNSGGKARSAVAGGQVDFIIISAEGSEGIREFLNPLAVVLEHRTNEWDAPPVNEALKPLGVTVPVLAGSIRGFAVSSKFKQEQPERYGKLVDAFEKAMTKEHVKKALTDKNIGAEWYGPEKTNAAILANYETFKKYSYLLKD